MKFVVHAVIVQVRVVRHRSEALRALSLTDGSLKGEPGTEYNLEFRSVRATLAVRKARQHRQGASAGFCMFERNPRAGQHKLCSVVRAMRSRASQCVHLSAVGPTVRRAEGCRRARVQGQGHGISRLRT